MTVMVDVRNVHLGRQLYLHVMTVHEAMHNLLQEEARLGLSKALALPHEVQQGSALRQLHHLVTTHRLNHTHFDSLHTIRCYMQQDVINSAALYAVTFLEYTSSTASHL